MLISVDRLTGDQDSTVSRVMVDGVFVCFGLEDQYRDGPKVPGETRIPAGRYKIKVRQYGGFHDRYADRFPEMHRGMLEVADVPGFTDILIHCGNTHKHTAGCYLPGTGVETAPGRMSVQNSETAYRKLYPMVIEAAYRGDLFIEYADNDRIGG